MARRMGVSTHIDEEVDELARDVAPEQVLDEIEGSKSANREESFGFRHLQQNREN
jgi:hypothetical protein